jgi:hypothetical protein
MIAILGADMFVGCEVRCEEDYLRIEVVRGG